MMKMLALSLSMVLLSATARAETIYMNDGFVSGNRFLQMSRTDQARYVAGVVDGYDFAWAVAKNFASRRGQDRSDVCRLRTEGLSSEALTLLAADYVRAQSDEEKKGAVSGNIIAALDKRLGKNC